MSAGCLQRLREDLEEGGLELGRRVEDGDDDILMELEEIAALLADNICCSLCDHKTAKN